MHSLQHLPLRASGLLGVLFEAPRLAEVMTPDALKATSATCTLLHGWFRKSVTVITIANPDVIPALLVRHWPSLAMVVITSLRYTKPGEYLTCLFNKEWTPLLTVDLTEKPETSKGLLPTSRKTVAILVSSSKLPDRAHKVAVARFTKQDRPKVSHLLVSAPSEGAQTLCHFRPGNWPGLSSLYLHGKDINAHALAHISKGRWPELEVLDISNGHLSPEAVSHLVKGKWKNLRVLKLWHCGMMYYSMRYLRYCTWSCVTHLDLSGNKLGASGMQYLLKGKWHSLSRLELDNTELDSAAMFYLSQGQWPLLRVLYFGGNNLDTEGIGHLVKGNWPKLQYLEVTIPHLEEAAGELLNIYFMRVQCDRMLAE